MKVRIGHARATLATAMTLSLTVGLVMVNAGTAGATTTATSGSTARFLSGTAGGTSFDTVAALNGESAKYPGDPGPNKNNLSGSVLGQAISAPMAVAVPGPGGISFGAVAQYAAADSDGSAIGATGAVDDQGAISVGGQDGVPSGGATINLSQIQGASALSEIGNAELSVGAVSGRAEQPALGKGQPDPAADCTSGVYHRVSSAHQAGSYDIAKLRLDLTSPALAALGKNVEANLEQVLANLKTAFKSLAATGLVDVSGLPTEADLAKDLSIDIFDGGLTASLADGAVHIDFAKILKYLHLDLNNLCPNTSLVPFLAQALAKLPEALAELAGNLTAKLDDSLGGVTVSIKGVPQKLTLKELTAVAQPVIDDFSKAAATALTDLQPALKALVSALTNNLLDVVVNGQKQIGTTFTETAVALYLLPGGAPSGGGVPKLPSLPAPPSANTITATVCKQFPTLPVVCVPPTTTTSTTVPPLSRQNASRHQSVKHAATRSAAPSSSSATPTPTPTSSSALPSLPSIKLAAFQAPIAARDAATPTNAALQLNLARASVTASSNSVAAASASTSPSSSTLPTAVNAGQAAHSGDATPSAAIAILALLAFLLVGGSAFAWRRRGGPLH